MSNLNLTGIILAGGKSARFKSPKYLATINGKTLLEIAISKLEPLCSEIIVVSKEITEIATPPSEARNDVIARSAATRQSPVNYVLEKDKHYHPLIGIKEGLEASHNEANVVLACDMPFVTSKTILGLINSKAEVCLYRYQGRLEPLLGFYRKSCLGKIAAFRQTSIVKALSKCNIDYIDVEDKWLDFFNINTKEDLIEAEKITQRNPQLLGN